MARPLGPCFKIPLFTRSRHSTIKLCFNLLERADREKASFVFCFFFIFFFFLSFFFITFFNSTISIIRVILVWVCFFFFFLCVLFFFFFTELQY